MAKKVKLEDLIRDARLRRNFTIHGLAEAVGVSPASISNWESGRSRPREYHLRSLCKELRMPIKETMDVAEYG